MDRVTKTVFAAGLLALVGAGPTMAADNSTEGYPYIERTNEVGARITGEQACRQVVNSAAALGVQLQAFGVEASRTLALAPEQLAHGMAHTMQSLANGLQGMAEQLREYRSAPRE